jgi:hypothetical protein
MPTNTRGFLDNISMFNIFIVGLSVLLGAVAHAIYNIREEAIKEVRQTQIDRNRERGTTVLSGSHSDDSDDSPVGMMKVLNSVFGVSDSQRAEMSKKLNKGADDRMRYDQ